jgi:hypothetical protein
MPDEKRKAKLTIKQRSKVLSWLAVGFNPYEVKDMLYDKYGVVVSRENIQNNYLNNPLYKTRLERYRRIFEQRVSDIPCAQKRGRLEIIQRTIAEALTWRTDKLYFSKDTDEQIGKVMKRNIGVIPALIAEARTEVGGEQKDADNNFELYFIELIKKVAKKEEIDGIRIARVERPNLKKYLS